jgi:regulatory protein
VGQQWLFEKEPVLESGAGSARELEDREDAYLAAMHRAGLILAGRPHATRELKDKLGRKDPDVTQRVIDRLTELGLLDDEDFARRWVEERSSRRGSRALMQELASKGVDREIAQRTIDTAALDEEANALDLASRFVGRVAGKPLGKQAGAIQAMLVRRGYPYDVAAEATKKVLPPEGWD